MQMQAGGGSPTNLGLTLQRWAQVNAPPVNPSTPGFNIGPIDLSRASSAIGPLGDGFDTPLIKGDWFSINLPGGS